MGCLKLTYYPSTELKIISSKKELTTNKSSVRGYRKIEFSNHLGNVLVTLSDMKLAQADGVGNLEYFSADVTSANDYYPFGMIMPGRTDDSPSYRYGYQGSEKDDEISGSGNSYTTHFRQLDPRLGRWFSMDPVRQPFQSCYTSMDNNPITLNDPFGDKIKYADGATRQDRKRMRHQAKGKRNVDPEFDKQWKASRFSKHSHITLNDKKNSLTIDGETYNFNATNVYDAKGVIDGNNTFYTWNINKQTLPAEIIMMAAESSILYNKKGDFFTKGYPEQDAAALLEQVNLWLFSDPKRKLTIHGNSGQYYTKDGKEAIMYSKGPGNGPENNGDYGGLTETQMERQRARNVRSAVILLSDQRLNYFFRIKLKKGQLSDDNVTFSGGKKRAHSQRKKSKKAHF